MTTLPVASRPFAGERAIELASSDGLGLAAHYRAVREATEHLCEPLVAEDLVVQSMPDASPIKWHLAHTTWFFETFLLSRFLPGYRPFHPQFGALFNSYYDSLGPRYPRHRRGLLSRPTSEEVSLYRGHVDRLMADLFQSTMCSALGDVFSTILLGIHHEQQHQELILTDLKHTWSLNPLCPVYREMTPEASEPPSPSWVSFPEGLAWIGFAENGFAFDNESPRHRVFVPGFQLSSALATNANYLAFIVDGGYERPELWLSDGWVARHKEGWTAPLYWSEKGGQWSTFTLAGHQPLQPAEPVCHVSFYEADAFARWSGGRLPTEAEWEIASAGHTLTGNFAEGGRFHPAASPAPDDHGPLYQMFGDVWQWTASPYVGYPGYQPAAGALGEYNGKFMCNQLVLRGASCATPSSHARPSYRNFFPPDARWQFSGIRLARDLA